MRYIPAFFGFRRATKLLLLTFTSTALLGCGGGGSNAPVDTLGPTISGSPSVLPFQFFNVTPSSNVPLVTKDGTLTVTALITDQSGVDDTLKPPMVITYDIDGTEFAGPVRMEPSLTTANTWTADIKTIVTKLGVFNGIKSVIVTASDKLGNQSASSGGVYFFSNP